jgi:tetratricopeptide (TPR) repeat protein
MSEEHVGFSGKVGKEGLSLDAARSLQEKLLARMEPNEVEAKANAAARKLLNRDFKGAIAAYEAIAAEHPERRGQCEGQIGACHYFLSDYEEALRWYRSAKDHGADEAMMDDNIAEAEEALGS